MPQQNSTTHTPVLLAEVMASLQPQAGDCLLDATLGTGEHTKEYLQATSPNGTVVGVDADPYALRLARTNLARFKDRVTYCNANFANLHKALNTIVGSKRMDSKDSLTGGGMLRPQLFTHILFDLGVGSHQLADSTRGFSFQSIAQLNMGFGQLRDLPSSQVDAINKLTEWLGHFPEASELIEHLTHDDLADVIQTYGEERYARRIASAIKANTSNVTPARVIADTIAQAVPANYEQGRINPATRTFQALRLAVNRELEVLAAALPQAIDLLATGGVIAIISFHSLEDRIVKQFFRNHVRSSQLRLLTKKPLRASQAEINYNPRAKSAKLRAAEKVKK